MTWNILRGSESGPFWQRNDWAERRTALRECITQAAPDILCVQEARLEQVVFLERTLPTHHRVGVGRDDGKSGGEHCAIFFNSSRFSEVIGGTFWLEEPRDKPPTSWSLGPKRICTWVRLRDERTSRYLRVYNVHNYLTAGPQLSAARIVLAEIALGDPTDAVIVAGDFNATPGRPSREILTKNGLRSSAKAMGLAPVASTYQFYGIRLQSLDDVFVNDRWEVHRREVVDRKPQDTFPSDHFGLVVDLD